MAGAGSEKLLYIRKKRTLRRHDVLLHLSSTLLSFLRKHSQVHSLVLLNLMYLILLETFLRDFCSLFFYKDISPGHTELQLTLSVLQVTCILLVSPFLSLTRGRSDTEFSRRYFQTYQIRVLNFDSRSFSLLSISEFDFVSRGTMSKHPRH